MAWTWYGVKTLYRTSVRGRAVRKDKHFEEDVSLVEERVVLVKARSFDEAIRRGEAEAIAYAASLPSYANRYGQPVKTRYLEACDAFRLFDQPGHAREVYSRTEVMGVNVSDAAIIDQLLGTDEGERSGARREMFVPG